MGNLGLHHARRHDGDPGRRLRRRPTCSRRCEAERCTALYGVPTMFIAELGHPGLRPLRPVQPAHRRDGRLAVPGRGDEGVRRPHAHERRDDLLRHDRDVAGVDPDAARRLAPPPHGHRGPRPPARRDPHRRPGRPARRSTRGATGEFCTRGYSVMQGYWNDPERTAEAIDADGWMHTGDLAVMDERRLRQHRRADQGHGHPRRRERLPARDRGVPLHPSRRRGRPGHRRARRALRRGADGLGPPPARRRRRRRRPRASSAGAASPTSRSPATSRSSTSSR